jgi:hypothetical protein
MIGNNYYYFTPCCHNLPSFGISSGTTDDWSSWFNPETDVSWPLSVGSFLGCVTYSGTSGSNPLPSFTIYTTTPIVGQSESDCIKCVYANPSYDCPQQPPVVTPIISGHINECGVITIMPMLVECVSIPPSSIQSSDGEVSVIISGGTPPYTVYWSSSTNPSMGIHPALHNLPNDTYAATVVDYYGDFTETVYCTINTYRDCSFGASITEYT